MFEFRSVGFDVCEMLKIAHANKIVLMDLKPANIVRVCNVRDGSIHHKTIDFDHAIELHKYIHGTSSSSSAVVGGTPRYIAPEVARAMLTGNNEQQQHYQFKPTVAIDVFSFALWVFEVYNHQVSLWEQLGADITNDQEVLVIATQLTDEQIDRVINKRFNADLQ